MHAVFPFLVENSREITDVSTLFSVFLTRLFFPSIDCAPFKLLTPGNTSVSLTHECKRFQRHGCAVVQPFLANCLHLFLLRTA